MDDSVLVPLLLSLRVSLVAIAFVIPAGTLLGLLFARRRFPGRTALESALMLPMVLPPTVTGYYLIVLLGRNGPLGNVWYRLTGFAPPFTWQAAAIAAAVVSLPIMVRSASAALGSVDPTLEEASYCLGKGRWATFFRVSLPLASRGLLAGTVLAYARALGEFGATLMFAGSIPGRTQTLPLAIFEAIASGQEARARTLAIVLTLVSVGVVVVASRFEPTRG